MWFDEIGVKHNGISPYEQRKLAELRNKMTIEEKHKEKIEDACRYLNNLLYYDSNTENIIVNPFAYKSKKEIIDDFRKLLQIE